MSITASPSSKKKKKKIQFRMLREGLIFPSPTITIPIHYNLKNQKSTLFPVGPACSRATQ